MSVTNSGLSNKFKLLAGTLELKFEREPACQEANLAQKRGVQLLAESIANSLKPGLMHGSQPVIQIGNNLLGTGSRFGCFWNHRNSGHQCCLQLTDTSLFS